MSQTKNTSIVSYLIIAVIAFAIGAAASWFALQFMGPQSPTQQDQPAVQASSAGQASSMVEAQPEEEDDAQQAQSSGQTQQQGQDGAPVYQGEPEAPSATGASVFVEENGTYTSKDEVAAYIHEFGHLPSNYISKSKAKKAGWVSKQGNLDEVLPGMSIGGSEFYNDEGLLPDAPGRTWTECDINYEGGYRGAERIVFSDDGLIFYTADHYETFERLY